MKRTTEWRPDTCNCIVEYCWNDSTSEEEREHTEKTVTSVCEFHSSLKTNDEIISAIETENIAKNVILQKIAEENPEYATTTIDDNGNETITPDLKKIESEYDDKRELHISLSDADAQKVAEIQSSIEETITDVAVTIR